MMAKVKKAYRQAKAKLFSKTRGSALSRMPLYYEELPEDV